ncbi:activator of basal transcription 1-like [Phlebotomus argentipes]|uniref:activator of basal transcription 1-like n=1 Tax=Phlebotomus argentipes TaxID=94469 RepID=UPI0028929C51|nr:activator of basal transcription 1-like [Phlebotomus argentipes]
MSSSESENCNAGQFVRLGKDMENVETSSEAPQKTPKKRKRGIVYISGIPKYMNVAILKEFIGEFGKVGRVYLQNNRKDDDERPKKKQKHRRYTEGWIEFESKKVAKLLVQRLNGKPITTRKRSKFCDILWNLKYLSGFTWAHLSERLTYEKAVYKQRLQTEISMARKEANFYSDNLERSEKMRKRKSK